MMVWVRLVPNTRRIAESLFSLPIPAEDLLKGLSKQMQAVENVREDGTC